MNTTTYRNIALFLFLIFSIIALNSCSDIGNRQTAEGGANPAGPVSINTVPVITPVANDVEGDIEPTSTPPYYGPTPGQARSFKVELTLSSSIPYNSLTRYISFRNGSGSYKRVPIKFYKKTSYLYRGYASASSLNILKTMNQTGNRWYWDDMYIENRGGSTPLAIKRIFIEIKYAEKNNFKTTIPLANGYLNATLKNGFHKISLNNVRETALIAFSGFTANTFYNQPLPLQLAIFDFGKTGSDGPHNSQDLYNPKYDTGYHGLCTEFVSWYLYEGGITMTGATGTVYNFQHETYTTNVKKDFQDCGRLYRYNSNTTRWVKVTTGVSPIIYYTPKPGDYLIRARVELPNDTILAHSMMLLGWDETKNVARVINGPWPVTIRTVDIHSYVTDPNRPREYYIGEI